ncbi:MAG TPA: hypothetical protein VEL79_01335 [Vicinamibacterales bacterium]|nr:hypothetical protein [Vicinamibacterales bacterium]
MKFSRLLAVFSVVCIGASLAIAQDSIRLQFEVVKDGATVAKPEVSVAAGSTGTLEVADVGNVAFIPTLRGSDDVSIAFDIRSGGKEFRPRLVISKDQSGTLSWGSDGGAHSLKIKVSWER